MFSPISRSTRLHNAVLLALGVAAISTAYADATGPQTFTKVSVPAVLTRSTKLGHLDSSTVLHLGVSIAPKDPAALQAFADDVNNPVSPNYGKFLTPSELGAKFGQPASVVNDVANYLKSKGIKVKLVADNRLTILADATVSQAESAFSTSIYKFTSNAAAEPGNRNYFSYTSAPKVPQSIASVVTDISGMETNTKFTPRALTPNQTEVLYNTYPLRSAGYNGEGRTIGISNWDGYRLSNVPLFYSKYSLPTPSGGVGSNIKVVTLNGGSGSGTASGEGDLDIQMVLGAAPLCNLVIYDDGAGDLIGLLTQQLNDNAADIITESYGWRFGTNTTAESCHTLHVAMNAQGITYMAASGDSGTSIQGYPYPDSDPEVCIVGGTTTSTDTNGSRVTETGWSGGGGGWTTTTYSFNTLPSWQKGTGVPTNVNKRLVPDVAFNADPNTGFYTFVDGSLYVIGGTSASSPTFAGMLGIAQQRLIALGFLPANSANKRRMGRIQDLIYSQNGRSDVWYDVTAGTNGILPSGATSNAGLGWDFVTGWGPMDVNAFVRVLTANPPTTVNASSIGIYSTLGQNATGTVSSVKTVDSNYYTIGSVSSSAGQTAAAEVAFAYTIDPTKVNAMTITYVANSNSNVTGFIYLYNYTTGKYDATPVSTFSSGSSNVTTTVTIPSSKVSQYLSSTNKQVKLIARGLRAVRTGNFPFNLNIDRVIITFTF